MSERAVRPLAGSIQRRDMDDLVASVAPVMPPCFAKRATWVAVLRAAQADPLCPPDRRPLTPDGRFNYRGVNFCLGCTPQYKLSQGHLCRPDWFRDEDEDEGGEG